MTLSDRTERRLWRWLVRVVALLGVLNEVFLEGGERPFLLTFLAALIGLPNFMTGPPTTLLKRLTDQADEEEEASK